MIAGDANPLVSGHRPESGVQQAAAKVVRELAEGSSPRAIPWPCCDEFLSIVTNPPICGGKDAPQVHAWRQLNAWIVSPSKRLIGETDDFPEILRLFVQRPLVHGAVVHDAAIAAICVTQRVEAPLTRDRHFSLFPELRTRARSRRNRKAPSKRPSYNSRLVPSLGSRARRRLPRERRPGLTARAGRSTQSCTPKRPQTWFSRASKESYRPLPHRARSSGYARAGAN